MFQLDFLDNARLKSIIKALLLVITSYVFLGVSQGSFLFHDYGTDTLLNFLFTLICVASSWLIFKQLYLSINQYHTNHIQWRKMTFQLLSVAILTLLILGLNWFYIEILWKENLSETLFFPVVLPMAIILFSVWVFGYPLLQQRIHRPEKFQALDPNITATKGRRKIIKPASKILGFMVEKELVYMVTQEGDRFRVDSTLSLLEDRLTKNDFLRVNRQLLLSKASIDSYQSLPNGTIELDLDIKFGEVHNYTISRYKASKFRKWMLS